MKTILVVEDSTDLQQLYQEQLKAKGFDVTIAPTAQKALTFLQTTVPDLMILDIMLPGGANGFDVLEQMKRDPRLKDVPVFVVTNLDSEEKTARQIGITEYIVKSNVSFGDIIEKIVKFFPN